MVLFSRGLRGFLFKSSQSFGFNPCKKLFGLNEGKEFKYNVPSGHNSFIYLLKGELKIGIYGE